MALTACVARADGFAELRWHSEQKASTCISGLAQVFALPPLNSSLYNKYLGSRSLCQRRLIDDARLDMCSPRHARKELLTIERQSRKLIDFLRLGHARATPQRSVDRLVWVAGSLSDDAAAENSTDGLRQRAFPSSTEHGWLAGGVRRAIFQRAEVVHVATGWLCGAACGRHRARARTARDWRMAFSGRLRLVPLGKHQSAPPPGPKPLPPSILTRGRPL